MPNLYNGTTSSTAGMVWVNTSTATTTTSVPFFNNNSVTCSTIPPQQMQQAPMYMVPDHIRLNVGHARRISFPDGTDIFFKDDGSFFIEDKDAKVIYRANRSHNFNPFINASDKLEEFIKFCGAVGVRQGDMLGIPVKHFIQWLVIEAAKADGDTPTTTMELPYYNKKTRCRTCKRFMSPVLKADGIEFCRPKCLEVKLNKYNRSKHNGKANSTYQIIETSPQAARD